MTVAYWEIAKRPDVVVIAAAVAATARVCMRCCNGVHAIGVGTDTKPRPAPRHNADGPDRLSPKTAQEPQEERFCCLLHEKEVEWRFCQAMTWVDSIGERLYLVDVDWL